MKLLVAVAIGGALGTAMLPHLPEPKERETPFQWVRREFTLREPLWDRLEGYPRWDRERNRPLVKYE